MSAERPRVHAAAPGAQTEASMKPTFVKVLLVQAVTLAGLWFFQAYFTR